MGSNTSEKADFERLTEHYLSMDGTSFVSRWCAAAQKHFGNIAIAKNLSNESGAPIPDEATEQAVLTGIMYLMNACWYAGYQEGRNEVTAEMKKR